MYKGILKSSCYTFVTYNTFPINNIINLVSYKPYYVFALGHGRGEGLNSITQIYLGAGRGQNGRNSRKVINGRS